MASLYEKDFYGWCIEQGQFLSLQDWENLDYKNLFEEIRSMGAKERSSLRSFLANLYCHLLKMKMQPDYPNIKSWVITICNSRDEIQDLLFDSPSLKYSIDEIYISAVSRGRKQAIRETGMDEKHFKKYPEFTLQECLKEDWFPS